MMKAMDSARTSVKLLLAACAFAYPSYMTACAIQLLLPTLVAAASGHVLVEEIRITPLWLLAWGYSIESAPRWLMRNGPLLFGAGAALVGMVFAVVSTLRRAGRWPTTALFLLQVSLWNAGLLAGRTLPTPVAAALLFAGLLCLIRVTADYASSWEAVGLGFLTPFLTILVILWRVGGRMPGPGPRSAATTASVAVAMVLLAMAAAAADWFWRRVRSAPPLSPGPSATPKPAIAGALCSTTLIVLMLGDPLRQATDDWPRAHYSTEHYDVIYSPDSFTPEYIHTLAVEREQRLPAMLERLGRSHLAVHLRLHLYSNYEEIYARTRSTQPYTVQGDSIFALVHDPNLPQESSGPDFRADAEALVGTTVLPPASETLPFLRLALIDYVSAEPSASAHEIAGRIEAEEGPYSLTLLSNTDYFISPIVRRAMAAEFAAWVTSREFSARRSYGHFAGDPGAAGDGYIGQSGERSGEQSGEPSGADTLFDLATAEPGGPDWRLPLEHAWRMHLMNLARHTVRESATRVAASGVHYGVSFSNDGGIRTGYLSETAARELHKLAQRGANSVVLTALLPAPDASLGGALGAGGGLGLTSGLMSGDEAINHAAMEAHRANLTVMLKPAAWDQGWRNPARAPNRAGWTWNAYRQWMLHYARLAEMNHTDLLCVGGFLDAVAGNPGMGSVVRDSDWRRLIADIRRIYHGPLTFAASAGNDGTSLSGVTFWDALDYIGVDDFLPLADHDSNTSPVTLREHAERLAGQLAELAAQTGKPVILTEVGYPSVRWGATSPFKYNIQSFVDLELQKRCYEATVAAFHGRPWLQGAYWSRWPSSGFGGGPEDGGFTPLGKPAETVMAKMWQ
jgi:hypothetical protein